LPIHEAREKKVIDADVSSMGQSVAPNAVLCLSDVRPCLQRKRDVLANSIAQYVSVRDAAAIAEVGDSLHAAHKQGQDKPLPGAAALACHVRGGTHVHHEIEVEQVRWTMRHPRLFRAVRAGFMVILVVVAGALFFRFGTESQNPRDFWDCVYFAVTMCTTVGFGDYEALYARDSEYTETPPMTMLPVIGDHREVTDAWPGAGPGVRLLIVAHFHRCCCVVSASACVSTPSLCLSRAPAGLFASVYAIVGSIVVAFAVSVIVEVSLNLEGKERQAVLDKLFTAMTHDDLAVRNR
jgi:hypothetical protein